MKVLFLLLLSLNGCGGENLDYSTQSDPWWDNLKAKQNNLFKKYQYDQMSYFREVKKLYKEECEKLDTFPYYFYSIGIYTDGSKEVEKIETKSASECWRALLRLAQNQFKVKKSDIWKVFTTPNPDYTPFDRYGNVGWWHKNK